MYARILVPLDGSELSEQVLPYVGLLGKALQPQIVFLGVNENPHAELSGDLNPALHQQNTPAAREKRILDYLESRAEGLKGEGLAVFARVQAGSPAECIVKEAESTPGTLVAITTHGHSGIGRWFLGSVADKVLHASTNPMLVVRAQPQNEFTQSVTLNRLIVPLDGSALAELVLPDAISLAKTLNLRIYLLRVTASSAEYHKHMAAHPMDSGSAMSYLPYEEYAENSDHDAEEYLSKVKEANALQGYSDVEVRLVRGNPAETIVDVAGETAGSLVAMTTHGRSGLGRWVLGSVAERVLQHPRSPVLLIRAAKTH